MIRLALRFQRIESGMLPAVVLICKATVDNNLSIVSNLSYHDETFGGEVFYTFESFPQDAVFMPFYKKIYYNARNKIHDYLS